MVIQQVNEFILGCPESEIHGVSLLEKGIDASSNGQESLRLSGPALERNMFRGFHVGFAYAAFPQFWRGIRSPAHFNPHFMVGHDEFCEH